MNFAKVIAALGIPPQALVELRVPKKLFLEHGAPTAADKRQLQDGIEEVIWVAALKPTNISVPVFKDEAREYLEVEVLTVALRPSAKARRLIELIHRAIPYPLVLITGQGDNLNLSLAHKRWSQGETGKVVLDDLQQIFLNPLISMPEESDFLGTLTLSRLPAQNLFTLYEGINSRIAALQAARITGTFTLPGNVEHSSLLQERLDQHGQLQRELVALRARAGKETQINRRVELNLEIQRLEKVLYTLKQSLGGGVQVEEQD